MSLAHLTFYRRDSRPSALSPSPPPPFFLSILTTLAPCSIHKPRDDKCPPSPGQYKTMPHSSAEYHPSRKSSIRDTKDEMLLQLPFFTKRVSHFSYSSVSLSLPLGFFMLRVRNMEHCSLMSCFCLCAVQQRIRLTENRHFEFTQDSLVVNTN